MNPEVPAYRMWLDNKASSKNKHYKKMILQISNIN